MCVCGKDTNVLLHVLSVCVLPAWRGHCTSIATLNSGRAANARAPVRRPRDQERVVRLPFAQRSHELSPSTDGGHLPSSKLSLAFLCKTAMAMGGATAADLRRLLTCTAAAHTHATASAVSICSPFMGTFGTRKVRRWIFWEGARCVNGRRRSPLRINCATYQAAAALPLRRRVFSQSRVVWPSIGCNL